MKYAVKFPNSSIEHKFSKILSKIPPGLRDKIIEEINKLADNPRPYGQIRIKPPVQISQYIAQHRIRIGDRKVLYDIDDTKKVVWILALRKRSERTYK